MSTKWSNNDEQNRYWGREDDYRRWSQDIKEHASKVHPVIEDEARLIVIDGRGLWVRQAAYRFFSCQSGTSGSTSIQANVWFQRDLSLPFVNLAQHLRDTALAVNIDELSMVSEIIDAIELQLRVLGLFGDLYYREAAANSSIIIYGDFDWHHDLQPRIRDAAKQADNQNATGHSRSTQLHSQHHQDNFLLQAMICIVLLACIYRLYWALKSSPSSPGSTLEADFWQQINNTVLQLAGFFTPLLPIYRETASKEWRGTWILTILGVSSAIIAVPLYLFAAVSWSAFFSWLASSAQLLVVLQVALVAAFGGQEHAKND